DRELPHGLGGVEQVEHVRGAGDAPDLGGRVDQSAAGGYPGQPDQLDPVVEQVDQRVGVDLTGAVVGHHDALDAGARRDLEVGEDVAPVLVAGGEDAVTPLERDRVERRVPGVGGVVEQRDLRRLATDQPGQAGVRAG